MSASGQHAPEQNTAPTGGGAERSQNEVNWGGIAYGLAIAVFAAYLHLKLPPVLPEMLVLYGYDRLLAGSFMSIYALIGLVVSLKFGDAMRRLGAVSFIYAAFALSALAAPLMLFWPENTWLFLLARGIEGVAFAILAIAGPAICNRNAGKAGLAVAAGVSATWIPLGSLAANFIAVTAGNAWSWRTLWIAGVVLALVLTLWTRVLARRNVVRFDQTRAAATARLDSQQRRAAFCMALCFCLWSTQLLAYLTWLPEFLVAARGLSFNQAILGYSVPVTIVAIFCLVAIPILRAGVPVTVLLPITLVIQAVVWFTSPLTGELLAAFLVLGLYGMAAGLTPSCLFALPATVFGLAGAGPRETSILMMGRNVGSLLGPILLAALVNLTGGWEIINPVFGAISLASAGVALYLHGMLRATTCAGGSAA